DVGRGVVIVDDRGVDHSRVRDVHSARVFPAHMVGGEIGVVPAQCDPAHTTAPDSDRDAKARAASYPRHQRRSIHRTLLPRSRNPSAAAALIHPAAIVERSKSPGGVIHPGPPPRLHPGPVAFVVGSPARIHVWIPHRAILRRRLPGTVAVQSLVAYRSGGNVLSRGRRSLLPLARHSPSLEGIAWHRIRDRILQRLPIAELEELAAGHVHRAVWSARLPLAAA